MYRSIREGTSYAKFRVGGFFQGRIRFIGSGDSSGIRDLRQLGNEGAIGPKITQWGWRGGKLWNDAVKILKRGGTNETLLENILTREEAIEFLRRAGVDLESPEFPIELGHESPNPHTYPHINYPAPNGTKGTIRIQGL